MLPALSSSLPSPAGTLASPLGAGAADNGDAPIPAGFAALLALGSDELAQASPSTPDLPTALPASALTGVSDAARRHSTGKILPVPLPEVLPDAPTDIAPPARVLAAWPSALLPLAGVVAEAKTEESSEEPATGEAPPSSPALTADPLQAAAPLPVPVLTPTPPNLPVTRDDAPASSGTATIAPLPTPVTIASSAGELPPAAPVPASVVPDEPKAQPRQRAGTALPGTAPAANAAPAAAAALAASTGPATATTAPATTATIRATSERTASPEAAAGIAPGGAERRDSPAALTADPIAAELQPMIAAREAQPVAQLAGISAPSTPAGLAPAATAPATQPHDFATLVDRLVEARDAIAPQAVTAAIAHADFGSVSLRIRHDEGGLAVSMASADPGFAPAVQAAVAASQPSASADNGANPSRQDAQQQAASQGQTQAQGQASSQGQPRARDAAQRGTFGETTARQSGADETAREAPDAGGIYA